VLILNMLTLVPVTTIFPPLPKASVRALVLLEENDPVVNVLPSILIVPVVSVQTPVHNVGLPDNNKVMSDLLTVVVEDTAVDVTVTVAAVPELASKVAVSVAVGGPAGVGPPDVSDQLALLELSQVPEPPNQKYAAIVTPQ
jgi:hypothetical protein